MSRGTGEAPMRRAHIAAAGAYPMPHTRVSAPATAGALLNHADGLDRSLAPQHRGRRTPCSRGAAACGDGRARPWWTVVRLGRSTRATSASAGRGSACTHHTNTVSQSMDLRSYRPDADMGAGPGIRWPTPGAPTSAPSNSSSRPIWGLADALRVGDLSTRQCGFCGSKRFPRPRSTRLPDRGR